MVMAKTCKRCGVTSDWLVWQLDLSSQKWKLWDNRTERWHECELSTKPEKKTNKRIKCKWCDPQDPKAWIPADKFNEHNKSHINYHGNS